MAVEARHLTLFPPQFLGHREIMDAFDRNGNSGVAPMGYGVPPLSVTTAESLFPMYGSVLTDSIQVKTPMKSDSGLTYALPVSRKRSREPINPLLSFQGAQNQMHVNRGGPFTFLGEDISLQIRKQQSEIDQFISEHTEKVRLEIDEQRTRHSRRIIAAVEGGFMKKLKAKEEEIEKIGKLNWALEEKVKSLCIENQIWRDLAQTNEATANVLRSNLEQVLAQVQDDRRHRNGDAELTDDAESCCGSNFDDEKRGEVGKVADGEDYTAGGINGGCGSSKRWCRNCGKKESCVLLLPCRHLCLCTVCGSSVHTCPVCKSAKTASVHVNLSS